MGTKGKKMHVRDMLWHDSDQKVILEERALQLRQELKENKRSLKLHNEVWPRGQYDTKLYLQSFRNHLKQELKTTEKEIKKFRR